MKETVVPTFNAFVDKLGLHFTNKPMLGKYLKTLVGKKVKVSIKLERKTRTDRQNKWYWACVVGIPAEGIGYTPDEMHEAYKLMFLSRQPDGKPRTIRSTATLTKYEFSQYVELCRRWAAGEGYVIPDPEGYDL